MYLREVAPELDRLVAEYNSEGTSDERRLQIESEIDELSLTVAEKADSIAELIAHYESKAEILKEEIERLTLWRKREENSASWLERYLSTCLLRLNTMKLETDFHKFSFRKSEALKVVDEGSIPDRFFIDVPATKKLDNAVLKKAIQGGEIVEGAIVEVRQNLNIK